MQCLVLTSPRERRIFSARDELRTFEPRERRTFTARCKPKNQMITFTAEKPKAPEEIKWYRINWQPYLGEATIVDSLWYTNGKITIDTHSATDTVAEVYVSGGTAERPQIKNVITTTDDQTLVALLTIPVETPYGTWTEAPGEDTAYWFDFSDSDNSMYVALL